MMTRMQTTSMAHRADTLVALLTVMCLGGCAEPAHLGNRRASTAAAFHESATEAGIDFVMSFLPGEQGKTYKVNLYDHGSGLAIGDFDADGHDDLYLLNQKGANGLYRNRGDGSFENVTRKAGVELGDRVSVGAVFADYDNDGLQDLFVTSVRRGNTLFHNEGGGRFRDVTREAGVAYEGHSQSGLFFDYDRDGDLDLFVTNTGKWTTGEFVKDGGYFAGVSTLREIMDSEPEKNLLYRNDGPKGFTDVTSTAGVGGLGWAADAIAIDYDEDGWRDLFVTNMFGRSQLYRNTGKGVFVDLTSRTLIRTSWGGMGARTLDADGDGRLDLYLLDMHSDMWTTPETPPSAVEEERKYSTSRGRMGGPSPGGPSYSPGGPSYSPGGASTEHPDDPVGGVVFGNTLFRSEGAGRFSEISDRSRLETFWPWGAAAGDFDSDGAVDLFIPSGMGYPFFYWPNALMVNRGNGTFEDRAEAWGMEPPVGGIHQRDQIAGKPAVRSSRAAATADFDGDGRLDIVVNNFNDRPYYFRNKLTPRSYLRLDLKGTRSNRDALGALVRLYAGGKVMVREVEGAGGYLSCPSKIVHFGLGDLKAVDRIEIRWPSGRGQIIRSPRLNTLLRIDEPA
jgi:enediyne biosynthesis protein E4